MCLNQILPVPENEQSGIAFKWVRKTALPNIFRPIFDYFSRYGNGGTVAGGNRKQVWTDDTCYKVGQPFKVKHRRTTRCRTGGGYLEYRAGVHLYKTRENAIRNFREGCFLKKFAYSKAVAQDFQTIVALEVTLLPEGDQ